MTILSKIELAFGADLTANPATWVWTDISLFALGSVRVGFGRANEASQIQPATCAFRLRNTDARFSPRFPTSPYYPNVRRQTPMRGSLNPGTGYVQRFQGYVDDIVPVWPSGNSDYAEVLVTASGITRRLTQGDDPLRSAPVRYIPTTSPVAYWSLEDGQLVAAGTPIVGTSPLIPLVGVHPSGAVISYPQFGQGRLGPWLAPVVSRSGNAGLTVLYGGVSMPAFSNTWTVDFMYASGTGAGDGAVDVNPSYLPGGATGWPQIQLYPSAQGLWVTMNAEPETQASTPSLYDGNAHHIRWTATQAGTKVSWAVYLDGAIVNSGTTTGNMTLPPVTYVALTASATSGAMAQGHLAVWTTPPALATAALAAAGWAGETAGARITRLCAEESIVCSVSSTTGTVLMGPQGVESVMSLLRACESADGGILYDGISAGLTYVAAQDRENLAVSMALDCKQQQVKLPFAPVENDQLVRNRWTVSRANGLSTTASDTTHIAANGLYKDSATVNVLADVLLLDQAGWRVNLGTVEEMRVPGLSLQLVDHPELWSSWLAMTVVERLTAVNLPVQYPPGILDMIVEGGTEEWDAVSWLINLNTSPFAPWRVFCLAADTNDTNEFCGHLDTDDSALNAGITATAASFAVKTNSGPLWTIFGDDFPFDINVGGEQIRVNSITGGTSPQTFNVTRSRNGVVKAHLINAPVSLWAALVLAK